MVTTKSLLKDKKKSVLDKAQNDTTPTDTRQSSGTPLPRKSDTFANADKRTKEDVPGMSGAYRLRTDGGAVTPPQRDPRTSGFGPNGNLRYPLPGDVTVTTRPNDTPTIDGGRGGGLRPGEIDITGLGPNEVQAAIDERNLLMQREQVQQELAASGVSPENIPSAPVKEEFKQFKSERDLDIFRQAKDYGGISNEELAKKLNIRTELFDTMPTETIRDKALLKIRKDRYNEGLTTNEKIGAVLEGIGAFKIFDPWIRRPEEVADEIFAALEPIDDTMSQIKSDVAVGQLDPEDAISLIDAYEEDISEYQAKLQLLLNESSILRTKPEALDKISTKMVKAQERLRSTKISIAQEIARREGGTGSPIPTDEQLFYEIANS